MPKKSKNGQCAVLPFAVRDGEIRILLITSRETKRWIIPKGWMEKDTKPRDMAAKEAFEEAGIVGKIGKKPIWTYSYRKKLDRGDDVLCEVDVYAMEVERELDDWPERGERVRRWMSLSEAAYLISDSGMTPLLLNLAAPTPNKP
jgi:8-oxo-dGTP pyrophosphatase MutT (NUDIX family)